MVSFKMQQNRIKRIKKYPQTLEGQKQVIEECARKNNLIILNAKTTKKENDNHGI